VSESEVENLIEMLVADRAREGGEKLLEELGWKKVGRTRTLAAPIFTLDAHWRIEWKR